MPIRLADLANEEQTLTVNTVSDPAKGAAEIVLGSVAAAEVAQDNLRWD